MPTPKLTRDILLAALAGFQLDKQRIDTQIAEVQALLDGGATRETTLKGTAPSISEEASNKGTRRKSVAVRKRMAEAQRLRWLKIKGPTEAEPTSAEPVTPEAAKTKRKISAEGMKNIIAATKKRWRLQKAAAKAQSVPTKQSRFQERHCKEGVNGKGQYKVSGGQEGREEAGCKEAHPACDTG